MPLRLNARQLRELIEDIESNGGDASLLKRELEALEPEVKRAPQKRRGYRVEGEEPTTTERLNNRVGDLFAGGVNDDLLNRLVELDRNHSLKELREMCVGAGLGTGGDKKELAARLVAKGVL